MIVFLIRFWKYAVIAALIAALSGMSLYARRIAAERDELADGMAVLSRRVTALDEAYKRNLEAIEKKVEEERQREDFRNETKQQIERGRATGNGDLAPVLRDALRRLRERDSAGKSADSG